MEGSGVDNGSAREGNRLLPTLIARHPCKYFSVFRGAGLPLGIPAPFMKSTAKSDRVKKSGNTPSSMAIMQVTGVLESKMEEGVVGYEKLFVCFPT